MFDMMKMMGKVKEVQDKMKAAQENLARIEVEGESGAGMVKAVVNGKKKLVSLDIDPSLLNDKDKEMLQDLVIAAVNMATEKADEKAKEEIKKSTEGVLPNIPGFDFGSMV
ncbi:MAG: YbaB/EbfC family nucleoid-associated protein [Imperialibacter sp.]|jgi:nucleoid-associated protein EbfC|uniref:Nucleoid-associated protein RT717_18200 n=1 Tax=Imperialibacter roseus TaxID=1324217 RepID=A0ABZ0IMM8_9BACT|nr:YbaB/EbfC family nucleoid-associated protein [Imperialibacter roseus]WOK05016.1 YbaB/EbfC family nucleoid-associated protein [Imperialibacter roseus]